jgi:CxxC motif-containing protein
MKELICIVCPKGCHLKVDEENGFAVTGNGCPRGEEYGKKELTDPRRVITSSVRITGGIYPCCSVRTDAPIPKAKIFEAMELLKKVELHSPVHVGDVVIADVLGTGANFIVTRDM